MALERRGTAEDFARAARHGAQERFIQIVDLFFEELMEATGGRVVRLGGGWNIIERSGGIVRAQYRVGEWWVLFERMLL